MDYEADTSIHECDRCKSMVVAKHINGDEDEQDNN